MFQIGHRTLFILPAALALALAGASAAQAVEISPYFGHWTLMEDKPDVSSKGKLYHAIDVAPCGKDFCGVSVAEDGSCGPTLFRFLTIHARDQQLKGHGKWGEIKKTVVIDYINLDPQPPYVMLGLGEPDLDFTGREGSMPTYEANYSVKGAAHCTAK
jgi:hypothetical protein